MVSWYLQRHIKVQEKHISLYEGQATPQNKALKIPSFWLKRWLSAYLDGVFVETNSFLSDPSSIIVVTFFHSRLIEVTLADEDALLTLLLTLLITWWQLTAWQQLDNSTFKEWPQLRLFGNILYLFFLAKFFDILQLAIVV